MTKLLSPALLSLRNTTSAQKNPIADQQPTTARPSNTAPHQTLPPPQPAPGDSALVSSYIAAVQRKVEGDAPGSVTVPSQTVLGQWLELYRAQLRNPVVIDWLREQHIDPTTLKVTPATGAMSATVDGVKKQFSLTDGSGWGQVSGPLLAVAKVIVPSATGSLKAQWSGDSFSVSPNVVAGFYGEILPANVSQARTQIRRLEHDHTFAAIAPDDHLRSAQAMEIQRSNAERANSAAPQKMAFTRLAGAVANAYPNVREQAKQWAGDLLKQLTGKEIDPDTLYLNRFHSGQSGPDVNTVTGYEHMNEEPLSSQRLPEALLSNFSEHDQDPGTLDSISGIYTVGAGQKDSGGYGAHNEFKLAPSALMHASWKTDFQEEMTQKIDKFWSTRGDDYRTTLKGEFAHQARQQLKVFDAKTPLEQRLMPAEQQFSRADYELVMKAASNLPVDENTPVSVAQLQAEAPAKDQVRAYPLDINGWNSSDIIRFSAVDDHQYNYENNRRDGTQILYIPGAKPAFVRFDSLKKMDEWILDQAKDPKKREALASHFSLYNRQDGGLLGKSGVDSSLAHLADGTWPEFEGHTIDRNYARIQGDVFSHMKDQAKERMTSDADSAIKSDSEVTRDTWLNDITVAAGIFGKLAPLAWPAGIAAAGTGLAELALGAEKSVSGDTQAERSDGAWKAFDGTLNTLFSANASGKVEDPFTAPRENVTTLPTRLSTDSRAGRAVPNRLQPSQAGSISNYAVSDGEQLIANRTPNAKGIYQVKDANGQDQWLIRHTDSTGVGKVYEIRSDFKLSDNYVQIIDPQTRLPVMSVHASGNGEWVSAPANGGVKWPWQSPPSPTFSNEAQTSRRLSDGFDMLGDPKTSGAEKFDEIFKYNSNTAYEQSARNIDEGGVVKRKLTTSWTVEENNFEVLPSEIAQPQEHSSTAYSQNFIKDLNRDRYTVRIKQPDGFTTVELNATGTANGETLSKRLEQFESAIPDPNLRSRISEVAHQGSVAPTSVELQANQLQDHVGFRGKDTHYVITYDPATNTAQVSFEAQMTLLDLDQDAAVIPNTEVTARRTFQIRESNQLENESNPYTIDKSAPFTLSTSVITDAN
ncbi:dermonecrotic toxin domain-containing protein [Pseudomonas sp. S09G 359]|jgi:hypothetical protein|uniref:dermonecrotic toxin domain-containing protein n=1 Tax=Pseudomonas sp. S09G 359 TaxID=2054919 RepID=UPI0015A902ED|nr:DUF6543 domain-containing protein [Pseudomonas sp. S09G 359]